MSNNIIVANPLSDTCLVVWFENGISKRYEANELGVEGDGSLQQVHVHDDGSCIVLSDGTEITSDELLSKGEDANYVEDEKRRLLKNLSEIRREASFSQTRLGEAAGIRQSVISRIEGCEISPQINTLLKLLAPLGKTLAIVDLKDNN